MKTITMTDEDMAPHICHFRKIAPYKADYLGKYNVPIEAYEMIAAKSIYCLMAPENYGGQTDFAEIIGAPGLSVYIGECPPGDANMLHAHQHTIETFFCLSGRFEVYWNDKGENSVILDPFDVIAVPANVTRSFKNISDKTAYLLVLIQGGADEHNDVAYTPEVGAILDEKFGSAARDGLEKIGFNFTAGLG